MAKINLLNGRGFLGSVLSAHIRENSIDSLLPDDAVSDIYHTWNVRDKSQVAQKAEFVKFESFLSRRNRNAKLIFISTKSKSDDWYVHYKQKAEAAAIERFEDSIAIRLPTIIGFGSLQGIRNGSLVPRGDYELISVEQATEAVLNLVNYSGLRRIHEFEGTRVPAVMVRSLYRDVSS